MRDKAVVLKQMYEAYKLTPDDVFEAKDYTEIKKSGIKKIIKDNDLQIEKRLVYVSGKEAVVEAACMKGTKRYVTFGEASPMNNTFTFPVAVAEKRAEGRVVVDIMRDKFYGAGDIFSEDELKYQPKKVEEPNNQGKKANEVVVNELSKNFRKTEPKKPAPRPTKTKKKK